MGHRANYVFVKDTAATAYYDQWGALGSVLALADGPSGCRSFAEQATEVDELMDWAFCEGGFLLDHDEQRLIAFGFIDVDPETYEMMEPDDAERLQAQVQAFTAGPRRYLEHIAPSWRGWTLVWDDGGADAFAAHLKQRGITSLKTQPPSAPPGRMREELVVDGSRPRAPSKPKTPTPRKARSPAKKTTTKMKTTAKKKSPRKARTSKASPKRR